MPNSIKDPIRSLKIIIQVYGDAWTPMSKESFNCRDSLMQFGVLRFLEIQHEIPFSATPQQRRGLTNYHAFVNSGQGCDVFYLPNQTTVWTRHTFCNRCLTITQTIMKTQNCTNFLSWLKPAVPFPLVSFGGLSVCLNWAINVILQESSVGVAQLWSAPSFSLRISSTEIPG